jgi:hypothetical protein
MIISIITCFTVFFFLGLEADGPATSDEADDCEETLPASSSSSWRPTTGPGRVATPRGKLNSKNRSSSIVNCNKNNPV